MDLTARLDDEELRACSSTLTTSSSAEFVPATTIAAPPSTYSVPEVADVGDGDIDEDRLFNAGSSKANILRLSFDVYSLRSSDSGIYRKTATVLHDMAGVTIPEFILQILQVRYEDVEKDEDKSRRLYFDIDNKILKSLQGMHRAQICDCVKGFDLKLARVMTVLLQQYQDAAKELAEDVLEQLVPRWPDKMYSLPSENLVDSEGGWKAALEGKLALPVGNAVGVEQLPVGGAAQPPRTAARPAERPPSPPNFLSASTMASSMGNTSSWADSKISACSKVGRKQPALEYGLTFDIFAPEPRIFSVFMNPNLEYTVEPKKAPVDPDHSNEEDKESDSASQIWRQLKRVSTRVTRTLRGNPQYFVTQQDAHEK